MGCCKFLAIIPSFLTRMVEFWVASNNQYTVWMDIGIGIVAAHVSSLWSLLLVIFWFELLVNPLTVKSVMSITTRCWIGPRYYQIKPYGRWHIGFHQVIYCLVNILFYAQNREHQNMIYLTLSVSSPELSQQMWSCNAQRIMMKCHHLIQWN